MAIGTAVRAYSLAAALFLYTRNGYLNLKTLNLITCNLQDYPRETSPSLHNLGQAQAWIQRLSLGPPP